METNALKFLWKYVIKFKSLAVIIVLSLVFEGILSRLAFFYIAKIVDLLPAELPKLEILHKCIYYVILAASATILRSLIMGGYLFVEARFLPLYRSIMAKDLFKFAHKHSTAFFDEEMAGNISGKIRNILESAFNFYHTFLWGVLELIIAFSVTFFFLVRINLVLAFTMMAVYLFSSAVLFKISRSLRPYAEKRADASSKANGILVDSISNSSLVKGFSNYNYERRNYFRAVKKAALAARAETTKFAKIYLIQGFLRYTSEILFFTLPLYFWYNDAITVGDFVFIQTLIFTLSGMSQKVMMVSSGLFRHYGQISDGLKLLSKPYEVVDVPNSRSLDCACCDVKFDNVFYHYKSSTPLFKDFTLTIKQGQKVGLVGHSGAGKTTLIKLLSRNYDVQGGQIVIGGQDIKEVTQDSLRAAISLIPQDPSLFNRTIMENIRYGKIGATDEEVYEAAKKAFCHEFIFALPNGYDSKVGDRGVMLSGGERQRIAIARAILKNSPILILDEATSALDSQSEKYIQESLKVLMEGKTVIAIAHRLSTLREMDSIVVMEKGKIIEQGSHMSLLRRKGVYHGFYEMQSSGFINL